MQGMKCVAFGAALLVLVFVQPDPVRAQENAASHDEVQMTQAILDAEAAGRAIFLHDQAAAVATDAVMKLKTFRQDGKNGRLAGWITEQREGGIVVTFLSSEPVPRGRYRATVASDGRVTGQVEIFSEPIVLTEHELGAARARTTAATAEFAPCSRSYNTVVLPDRHKADDGWTVYLLPGTTQHGIVPVGGSYRLDLDPTGQQILRQRGFTRTCIALESPRQAAALMITHLLDPVPTEVHVFWSLWAEKPMYVGTSDGTWSIERGKITLVERREGGK